MLREIRRLQSKCAMRISGQKKRLTRVSLFGAPVIQFHLTLLLVAGMKADLGAKSGEMMGSPTHACTRVGSQQGSRQ